MELLRRRPKKAAVLGCGPAGLFAAHALVEAGWQVDIFSNRRRSEMYGAQYLHKPIPGLLARKSLVEYRLLGTPDQYRQKVYGETAVPSTSVDVLIGRSMAWDIRAAYWDAWQRYEDLIEHTPGITGTQLESAYGEHWRGNYRRIISSIPLRTLCLGGHNFRDQMVWAVGDAPERGVFCPIRVESETVVCNGEEAPRWYRASNVFGYRSAEWPDGVRPPVSDITKITKPIATDCTCHPWLERVGRYGTWTKGVLSHEAYEHAMKEA